ncbi:tyrosine-type recombinase/integrase [Thermanaerothrix daxensis]|uniref:tyrosine-type recombinase/integrase n=1 Tax=Thermanaerothrix daxensis TaxID=869279 RepID=UPI0006C9207D|nr:tyrosine-type recombinase/integrase [Thermanaerothrix daxensis]
MLDFSLQHSPNTAYRTYHPILRHFIRYVGDIDIAAVTPEMLKKFLAYIQTEYVPQRIPTSTRQGERLSGYSVDNHWKALRSFFRWCAATKLIKHNPALELPRPHFARPEIQPFSKEEISRLIYHAQYAKTRRGDRIVAKKRGKAKRDLAIVLLLLDTGIRLGELARLRIGDVNLETGEIRVAPYGTGRKTKARTIPIGKKTRRALWHYINSLEDDDPALPLFGLRPQYIRQIILSIGKSAEVPHTHPHRFRHTFAIEYLRNGGDVFTLQRILGHSSLAMVERYLQLSQVDLKEAHRRASPVDKF